MGKWLWLPVVVVLFLFQAPAGSGQGLEFVRGAEKFSQGIHHIRGPEAQRFLRQTLDRFLRSGKDSFDPEDPGGTPFHLILTRQCLLNHGWVLIYGVLRGPDFEGMDVVFLVHSRSCRIQVLYAEESGSVILARFLPDPAGNRVFLGRDWFHAKSCFSCFDIGPDGASRDERFENASRLAHVLVRRIIERDGGGEVRLFFTAETGWFGFRVHEWDENTPVKCEVRFDESARQLHIREGGEEGRRMAFPAFSR